VSFAGFSLPLPPEPPPGDVPGGVILGIRPTDLRHAVDAAPDEPRITVEPDLVEELGGVTNVLFPVDAPRVLTDATRAAIEAASDDDATLLADDGRARFCAAIDGRRAVRAGERLELAVDHRQLHFFDPATGEAISRRPTAVA
jgi:multiple sugar transport system ATP-binding protein